jgi:selenocysteine-specific elongation factor
MLQMLLTRGDLTAVSNDVVFETGAYQEMVGVVRAHLAEHGSITVAQARDMFGTSRKYVLALLEHLDQIGVTKRVGDERVLGRAGQNS